MLSALLLSAVVMGQGDDCIDARPIAVGTYGPYSTVGATTSSPAWSCAAGGNDVWFVTQANALGGWASFETCGSGFDTCIEVFDGTGGCGSLSLIICNDDACGVRSRALVTVTSGMLLYVRVGGFNGATGSFVLNASGNITTPTGFATSTSYGHGCNRGRTSFYEVFTDPATFDLANTGFTLLPDGTGGYAVIQGINNYVAPTPAATALALGDDDETMVTLTNAFPIGSTSTSSLEVCSNGFVSAATGNGHPTGCNPDGLLTAPATSWRNWHDYDPTAGGQVLFEEVGPIVFVTWDAVPDWNVTGSASTFQFQFDTSTGTVTYAFAQMSAAGGGGNGHAYVVGYSPGGASLDPGNGDLSAAIPVSFAIAGADMSELVLTAASRPVLGTSTMLETTNVPATATLGAQVLGLLPINPGLDLTNLGMAGCRQFLSPLTTVVITPASGMASWPLALPSSTGFAGVNIFAQSAMLV
ncbi:MAG: hypothetical protein KDC98_13675, partial [Planctomycetes bacterium]|nr:hypothetical protein [Planctomycetota bacterium]